MNKYQKFLINECDFYYISNGKTIPCLSNEQIVIRQNEDITITKYMLSISKKVINTIFSIKDGAMEELKLKESYLSFQTFDLEIDFENRIEAIKIVFIDNLADDLIIPVVYVEANKEQYYAKKEKERKDSLLKKADIKVSTGADLVNIYFQPCSEDYLRTEIILYKDGMMLAKYKVDEEVFFKSINGLAYGKYEFVLKQLNTKNETILETDKISFQIVPPNFGMGRHTVVNRI